MFYKVKRRIRCSTTIRAYHFTETLTSLRHIKRMIEKEITIKIVSVNPYGIVVNMDNGDSFSVVFGDWLVKEDGKWNVYCDEDFDKIFKMLDCGFKKRI